MGEVSEGGGNSLVRFSLGVGKLRVCCLWASKATQHDAFEPHFVMRKPLFSRSCQILRTRRINCLTLILVRT